METVKNLFLLNRLNRFTMLECWLQVEASAAQRVERDFQSSCKKKTKTKKLFQRYVTDMEENIFSSFGAVTLQNIKMSIW